MENHNWIECRNQWIVGRPALTDMYILQLLLSEFGERKSRQIVRTLLKCSMWNSLSLKWLHKPAQNNGNNIRHVNVEGGRIMLLPLDYGQLIVPRRRIMSLSHQGWAPLLAVLCRAISLKRIYTHTSKWVWQVIFIYFCMHTCIYCPQSHT